MQAPIDDLRDLVGLDHIEGGRIGAKLTVARLARDPGIGAWPALAQAAGALATPQIRAVATVGGNLVQAVRCAYARDPEAACLRRGGARCAAREGLHPFHGLRDSACLAVHPSTLACALLLYDSAVEVGGARRGLPELLREGLRPGELITHLLLPAPEAGERGIYLRASHRAQAEWPLVELAARRVGSRWAIAVGAVANLPERLPEVEALLAAGGGIPDAAATALRAFPDPPAQTAYKLTILRGLVQDALEALR